MGRSDRLHRTAGRNRTDRRPGVLEEKFQKVVRGYAGVRIAGRGGEPSRHHTLLRAGKGKSTWIRRLLPPEWREYYRNGMANPENKGPPADAKHAPHHQYGRV